MHRQVVAAALRRQRSATLEALAADAQGSGGEGGTYPALAAAARMAAVDHGLVTGRLVRMLRAAPTRDAFEATLAAAAEPWRQQPPPELRESLERWGDRAARMARRMPTPVAGIPVRGWFGRQPFSYLFVRRVLEEWAALLDDADLRLPPPEIGHCLSVGVLAALPAAALPRVELRSGVVRLVVDVTGAEDLNVPRGRPRLGKRQARRPPARVTWSFDFARRHYGPRVTEPPDAVVRLTADELALLAETGTGWRGNPRIVVEGDEPMAGALLDGIAPAEPGAGTGPAGVGTGPEESG